METTFHIIDHGSTAWKEAVALREDILRKPLGSVFTEEELQEERNHVQVIGQQQGQIIATAVLVPEGSRIKMQRVVVSDELRNGNIGSDMSDMMVYCESYAQQQGYEIIYCHARDSAVNFYRKNGYSPEGDYFQEDGIPHLKMHKAL